MKGVVRPAADQMSSAADIFRGKVMELFFSVIAAMDAGESFPMRRLAPVSGKRRDISTKRSHDYFAVAILKGVQRLI